MNARNLVEADVDANQSRDLLVAAGGVHVAANHRPAQHEVGDERRDDEEDETPAEAEEGLGEAKGADALGQRVDRVAVGDHLDQPLPDEQHAESLDEGRDLQPHDNQAIDQADAAAGQHAAENCKRHRQGHRRHQLGTDNRAEARHRSDRQVELAVDEENRLADRDDADEGDDRQDRPDVALRQERRLQQIEERDDDDEGGKHADLADGKDPHEAIAQRRCAGSVPLVCGNALHSGLPGARAGSAAGRDTIEL